MMVSLAAGKPAGGRWAEWTSACRFRRSSGSGAAGVLLLVVRPHNCQPVAVTSMHPHLAHAVKTLSALCCAEDVYMTFALPAGLGTELSLSWGSRRRRRRLTRGCGASNTVMSLSQQATTASQHKSSPQVSKVSKACSLPPTTIVDGGLSGVNACVARIELMTAVRELSWCCQGPEKRPLVTCARRRHACRHACTSIHGLVLLPTNVVATVACLLPKKCHSAASGATHCSDLSHVLPVAAFRHQCS